MKENLEEQIRIVHKERDSLTVSRLAFEKFYKKRGYSEKENADAEESAVERFHKEDESDALELALSREDKASRQAKAKKKVQARDAKTATAKPEKADKTEPKAAELKTAAPTGAESEAA